MFFIGGVEFRDKTLGSRMEGGKGWLDWEEGKRDGSLGGTGLSVREDLNSSSRHQAGTWLLKARGRVELGGRTKEKANTGS